MIVRIHRNHQGQIILAVCDKNLLGKIFTENDLQLDLSSDFYNGKEMSEQEILTQIKTAYILNIVGNESVGFALKHQLIEKGHIIRISNVPHAEVLIVRG